MGTVPKGWAELKRGILGLASGTTKPVVFQKNDRIRVSKSSNGKRS